METSKPGRSTSASATAGAARVADRASLIRASAERAVKVVALPRTIMSGVSWSFHNPRERDRAEFATSAAEANEGESAWQAGRVVLPMQTIRVTIGNERTGMVTLHSGAPTGVHDGPISCTSSTSNSTARWRRPITVASRGSSSRIRRRRPTTSFGWAAERAAPARLSDLATAVGRYSALDERRDLPRRGVAGLEHQLIRAGDGCAARAHHALVTVGDARRERADHRIERRRIRLPHRHRGIGADPAAEAPHDVVGQRRPQRGVVALRERILDRGELLGHAGR